MMTMKRMMTTTRMMKRARDPSAAGLMRMCVCVDCVYLVCGVCFQARQEQVSRVLCVSSVSLVCGVFFQARQEQVACPLCVSCVSPLCILRVVCVSKRRKSHEDVCVFECVSRVSLVCCVCFFECASCVGCVWKVSISLSPALALVGLHVRTRTHTYAYERNLCIL
jgi:hypothetical protein